jgi:hypothetical protein
MFTTYERMPSAIENHTIMGLSISETRKPLDGARIEILMPEGKYRFAGQVSENWVY